MHRTGTRSNQIRFPVLRRQNAHGVLTLTKNLSAFDSCWQDNQFSLVESHWVSQPFLGGKCPGRVFQHKTNSVTSYCIVGGFCLFVCFILFGHFCFILFLVTLLCGFFLKGERLRQRKREKEKKKIERNKERENHSFGWVGRWREEDLAKVRGRKIWKTYCMQIFHLKTRFYILFTFL